MSLTNDALKLAELDRQVVRAFVERHNDKLVSALQKYFIHRRDLKVRLLDVPVSTIEDSEAAATLRKAFEEDGLPTDRLIRRLIGEGVDDDWQAELSDSELWSLGDELLYSSYSHYDYIAAMSELRPLIHHKPVPETVANVLDEIRRSYAFEQYNAAYALCRTAIEVCIRDICVRRKLFPDLSENIVLFEKYQWSKLRDRVSNGVLRERLRSHYQELSSVLHGRKTASKESSRKALKVTLEIIEELYCVNEL